jgi:hypothetical protein
VNMVNPQFKRVLAQANWLWFFISITYTKNLPWAHIIQRCFV